MGGRSPTQRCSRCSAYGAVWAPVAAPARAAYPATAGRRAAVGLTGLRRYRAAGDAHARRAAVQSHRCAALAPCCSALLLLQRVFGPDQMDEFSIDAPDLAGGLKAVCIGHDGSGESPHWYRNKEGRGRHDGTKELGV